MIKISLTYAYIKPEVKKNDTAPLATASNKAYVGWLYIYVNYCLMGKEWGF